MKKNATSPEGAIPDGRGEIGAEMAFDKPTSSHLPECGTDPSRELAVLGKRRREPESLRMRLEQYGEFKIFADSTMVARSLANWDEGTIPDPRTNS